MQNENYYTVGELAKKMNTTVRTLQYYDKEGLLKPSSLSEGGRRLYTSKDMILLHQIQSLKFLGFSLEKIKQNMIHLEDPTLVIEILDKQKEVIEAQIQDLQKAKSAIDVLQEEIRLMKEVNFSKFADIIQLIRLNSDGYWAIRFFDDKLMTHIKERFADQPQEGMRIFDEWKEICGETANYQEQGILPESEQGQAMAKRWWDMILAFTGGDLSLLSNLMKFGNRKEEWNQEMKYKQELADNFIEKALEIYLNQIEYGSPKMEG